MKKLLFAVALMAAGAAACAAGPFAPQPLTKANTGIVPLKGIFAFPAFATDLLPAPPVAGVIAWDRTDGAFKKWDGTAWSALADKPDLSGFLKLDGTASMTAMLPLGSLNLSGTFLPPVPAPGLFGFSYSDSASEKPVVITRTYFPVMSLGSSVNGVYSGAWTRLATVDDLYTALYDVEPVIPEGQPGQYFDGTKTWVDLPAMTETDPSIPSKAGNALKFLRVSSGETALEWAAAGSGGTATAVDGGTGLDSSAWDGPAKIVGGAWSGALAAAPLVLEQDFVSQAINNNYPWYAMAMASGTVAITNYVQGHPGVVKFSSSTLANSGYATGMGGSTNYLWYVFSGGERFECVFKLESPDGNTVVKFGIEDQSGSAVTPPMNGVWFSITNTTFGAYSGKYMVGSASSGAPYQLTPGVWYRAAFKVNAAYNRIDFYLYTCADQAQVWTAAQTNSFYFPVTTGMGASPKFLAYAAAANDARPIVSLDYLGMILTPAR